MRRTRPFMLCLAIGPALLAGTACSDGGSSAAPIEPASVAPIAGTDVKAVTLTEDASRRIALDTAPITSGPRACSTIPYSAVLYDAAGDTWAYTNREPLVFVRERIEIDRIEGDDVILLSGPDNGVDVVTRGAAELYGAETGVGK